VKKACLRLFVLEFQRHTLGALLDSHIRSGDDRFENDAIAATSLIRNES
jgi:hypothetical protein